MENLNDQVSIEFSSTNNYKSNFSNFKDEEIFFKIDNNQYEDFIFFLEANVNKEEKGNNRMNLTFSIDTSKNLLRCEFCEKNSIILSRITFKNIYADKAYELFFPSKIQFNPKDIAILYLKSNDYQIKFHFRSNLFIITIDPTNEKIKRYCSSRFQYQCLNQSLFSSIDEYLELTKVMYEFDNTNNLKSLRKEINIDSSDKVMLDTIPSKTNELVFQYECLQPFFIVNATVTTKDIDKNKRNQELDAGLKIFPVVFNLLKLVRLINIKYKKICLNWNRTLTISAKTQSDMAEILFIVKSLEN